MKLTTFAKKFGESSSTNTCSPSTSTNSDFVVVFWNINADVMNKINKIAIPIPIVFAFSFILF